LSDAAREQYVTSRMKSEQMKCVAEGVVAQIETEEARRTQATSDDRFLARRRWDEARYRPRVDQRINVS